MSFNPENLRLERVAEGIIKHKLIRLDNRKTVFGRSSNVDFRLSGERCSKQHCEIFFRDGRIFIKDLGSQNGTFVENIKIPAQTERELFENDVIGFGVCPENADKTVPANFIFSVMRAETVEISDESSDDDILEIIDLPASSPRVSPDDQDTKKKILENQGVADLNVNPKDISSNGQHSEPEELQNKSSAECQSEFETEVNLPENEIEECPEATAEGSSLPSSTKAATKVGKAVLVSSEVASKFPNLLQKQQELRRWNQQPAKLIEAPNMKKPRKRRASSPDYVGTGTFDSNETPVKRKRGRPRKRPEELKEKLKKLAEANPPKKIPPKPKRGVKVKVTEDNRGKFLAQPVATSAKGTKKH